jgi:hypothetical protein
MILSIGPGEGPKVERIPTVTRSSHMGNHPRFEPKRTKRRG